VVDDGYARAKLAPARTPRAARRG